MRNTIGTVRKKILENVHKMFCTIIILRPNLRISLKMYND